MSPRLEAFVRQIFYLLILVLPWGVILRAPDGARLHVWMVDLLLAPAATLLAVSLLIRDRAALVPPLGIQALGLAVTGCIILNPRTSWLDAGQLVVYTYGAWLLASQAQACKAKAKVLFPILLFHLLWLSALGCWQALSPGSTHYLVRGILPNYHVFSAFLILAFLYVFPVLLIQRSRLYLVFAMLVGIGLYVSVKSPPALLAWTLALLAQVILLAYFRVEWPNSRLVLSSLGGMVVLALGVLIQPGNLKDIAEYLHPYEPGKVDLKFSRIQTILGLPLKSVEAGGFRLGIHDPAITSLEVEPRRRYDDLDSQSLITQRLVERMVALNMARKHPAAGVGIGKYQEAKDLHFGSVVKVNTTEPYSYSSLATALGTGGVILLIGLLSFLAGQVYNVVRAFREGRSRRALLIGAFGSAAAFLSLSYQMEILIAPTLVLFTVITSLGLRDYTNDLEAVLEEESSIPARRSAVPSPAHVLHFRTRGEARERMGLRRPPPAASAS